MACRLGPVAPPSSMFAIRRCASLRPFAPCLVLNHSCRVFSHGVRTIDIDQFLADHPEENVAPEKQRLLQVAMVGVPNAGKSHVVNRLVGHKVRAIGTTTQRALCSSGVHIYTRLHSCLCRSRLSLKKPTRQLCASWVLSLRTMPRSFFMILPESSGESAYT